MTTEDYSKKLLEYRKAVQAKHEAHADAIYQELVAEHKRQKASYDRIQLTRAIGTIGL